MARSETLNPDPVTELPLTPPAEEDEEEAAIFLGRNLKTTGRERENIKGKDPSAELSNIPIQDLGSNNCLVGLKKAHRLEPTTSCC